MGKDITTQAAQQTFEQHEAEQAYGENVQGGQTAMDQHLVHHYLEEQRCQQGEYLQHKGGHQDFAQHLAVFDDGWNKPSEVESGKLG